MKRAIAALALVPVLALLAGCGGDDEDPKSDQANTSLNSADDVEASQNAATAFEVGEFADLPGGARLAVTSLKVGGDDLGPWLETSIRFENSTDEAQSIPGSAGVLCAGASENGGSQIDGTVSLGDEVPAGSFKEGVLNLLTSGDGRTGEPVPHCGTPAFVQFEVEDPETYEPVYVQWPVPDEMIEQMDAVRTTGFTDETEPTEATSATESAAEPTESTAVGDSANAQICDLWFRDVEGSAPYKALLPEASGVIAEITEMAVSGDEDEQFAALGRWSELQDACADEGVTLPDLDFDVN